MKRLIYICFCHSSLGRSNEPIPVFILIALLCLLLAAAAEPQTAPPDTTIDGKHYALRPIETLIAQLSRNTATPITYRHTAFQGRLFATLDTVYAPLDLEHIHFLDEVALNDVVFLAPVHIRQAVFANGLSLQRSRFSADVDFSACVFHKHTTFKKAEFRAGVNFSASRHTAVASFIAADFTGRENIFDRIAFDHAAYFAEAHFSGRANFQDATFADLASFKETVWQQGASFAGARFGGRALFWDARFAAETTFATARADGEIAFNRSTFTGPVSFAGFIFAQPALFNRVTCADEATFAGAYFRKTANFTDGNFRADLRLNASFNQSLDLRRTRISLLDLQNSAGADSLFTAGTRLYLQQAHYQHILTRWRTLAGHLAAVDTLSFDDLEPVYATLRHNLQNQGLRRDANACFVEGMERRRRHTSLTDPSFYALSLIQISTRYGTDPTRLAFSAFCIVLACGFAYRLGRSAFATRPDTAPPSLGACLLFSLQTFFSTSTSAPPLTGAMRLLALLQALIGWICLALSIAILLSHMA